MDVTTREGIIDRSATATDSPSMLPVEGRPPNLSPLRPGSTLVVYQPNGTNGLRTPGRPGKSQHLAQIRSLGLLHDLQDYISSVECLAADQKRELEKVREEKRDMERCLARAEVAAQERPAGPVLDFSVSEVADLPPRLRALVEDNRGLRELVKRYRLRNTSLEHQVVQLQAQVLALADANDRLKQSLAECSRTPAEVEREDTLRRQLEVKIRQAENLEHSMGILRSKMETDFKLYRQNLASAAREKDALKRQLVATNKAVEERDKEIRALNVELRRIRRGAPPVRGGPPYHPPTFPVGGGAGDYDAGTSSASASASAAADAADAASTPPPTARGAPEPEERIRIMLLIVRDEIRVEVPVEVPVPVPMVIETPATPLARSPRHSTDGGERSAADEPQPLTEAQSGIEPQLDPEPALAPEPPGPVGYLEPPAEVPVSEPVVHDPAPEPWAGAAEQPYPVPLVEEASALSPSMAVDGSYEPSVLGLMEDGTLTAEASAGGMGMEGLLALEEEDATATATAVDQPPELQSQLDNGGGGMHVHASLPLPVPYARTQARAIAAKVASISAKISAHPVPNAATPGTTGAAPAAAAAAASSGTSGPAAAGSTGPASGSISRKPSGGSSPPVAAAVGPAAGGSPASVSIRGGPSLKAVGAASRK